MKKSTRRTPLVVCQEWNSECIVTTSVALLAPPATKVATRILDIKFPLPEALVDHPTIGAKIPLAFGVEHADVRDGRIEDFSRPFDDEAAARGLPPTIQIGVADAAPLVRGTRLVEDPPGLVHFGGTKVARNIQGIR